MKTTCRPIILTALFFSFPFFFINSCAFDLHHIEQVPTAVDSEFTTRDSFVLVDEVTLIVGPGYSRTLRAGTTWDYVFTILQGDVFKTKDQILTIESSNIYEAYIVVSSEEIVGFYLPVQKTFSPLEDVQKLNMRGVN